MPDDANGYSENRLISLRDVALLVYFAALIMPAWVFPDRWLFVIGRAIAWSTSRLRPARTARNVTALQSLFGERLRSPASRVHLEVLVHTHVHNMLYLRALRPRGWRPSIRIEGAEHVRSALADGRGAVIWTAPTIYDGLITKAGLATAGLHVGHLSHVYHHVSRTRFGIRVLNGFVRAAENRYLATRFVMRPENRIEALRGLRRWVERNGIATVTALGGSGGRTIRVPFLDGKLQLHSGAPELARRFGALLAVASTTRERDGSFVTRIEPLHDTDGRGRHETFVRAAQTFGAVAGARATGYPDQCEPVLYQVL